MDINDLKARDMGFTIERELEISMMTSALVTLNIAPNFVQVHSIFQSTNPTPREWQKSAVSFCATAPSGGTSKKNSKKYQYIRMEYCVGGDVESFVKAAGVGGVDVGAIRTMMFQMFFSLYAAREQLCLRHYDIKLLNFFLTDYTSLLNSSVRHEQHEDRDAATSGGSSEECLAVTYGFGRHNFVIPLLKNRPHAGLLKLADFGTCSVGSASLGRPITINMFTTLENVPPEYLFLGSHARESYSADAFSLGLACLHLLTGEAPYEELLKDVLCPPALAQQLKKIWMNSDTSSANPYSIIA